MGEPCDKCHGLVNGKCDSCMEGYDMHPEIKGFCRKRCKDDRKVYVNENSLCIWKQRYIKGCAKYRTDTFECKEMIDEEATVEKLKNCEYTKSLYFSEIMEKRYALSKK